MRADRWLWAVAGVLALLIAAIAVFAFAGPSARLSGTIVAAMACLLVLVGMVAFAGAYFLVIMPNQCPHCGKWGGNKQVDEKVLSREKAFGLVDRDATTYTWGGFHGRARNMNGLSGSGVAWGKTTTQERAPVIRTTYLELYQCPACKAEWTTTAVEEEEDFSRP